jgi:hypothetical protein
MDPTQTATDAPTHAPEDVREKILELDRQLLRAVEQRAKLVQVLTAASKGRHPAALADGDHLSSLTHASSGTLTLTALRALFTTVDAVCRSYDTPPRVAYVGAEGGSACRVAFERFGGGAALSPFMDAPGALDQVARGQADFAVVPYESESEGPSFPTIRALAEADLKLVGEQELSASGAEAGAPYRYAIVAKLPASRTGRDATAILFSLGDEAGALHDVLRHFKDKGCSLRRIQSRRVRPGASEYLFYVEVLGHGTDRPLVAALEGVKKETKLFKVIGSFPLGGSPLPTVSP